MKNRKTNNKIKERDILQKINKNYYFKYKLKNLGKYEYVRFCTIVVRLSAIPEDRQSKSR